ncbi:MULTISPECIES: hypothetical protein [Paenibacillus]|uniref:hypothetical protein n=1 Tax=Paenibacillus TaxID=44249 RepID=UPI0013DF657E|nr:MULTISPECIES: hypothetical protein [Paenibacillus]
MQEKQETVTDTFLEDYEEFMDEDDRWCPAGRSLPGARDRNGLARRRRGTRL